MGNKPLTTGLLVRLGLTLYAAAAWAGGGAFGSGAALAQENKPKQRLFVSDNPKQNTRPGQFIFTAGEKGKHVLWLRPNTATPVYLYVDKPDGDKVTLDVVSADDSPLAGGTLSVAVDKAGVQRYALPVPQPPKDGAGKPPPPAEFAGAGLAPQLKVRLLEGQKEIESVRVGVFVPAHYVGAVARYEGKGKPLVVTVEAKDEFFAGGPCPVELTLEVPDGDTGRFTPLKVQKGVTRGVLSPEQKKVELFTDDPQVIAALARQEPGRKGRVSVTVDGYARAFQFEAAIGSETGDTTLPQIPRTDPKQGNPQVAQYLHLQAAPFWPADVKYPVRLGLDNVLNPLPAAKDGGLDPLDFDVTLLLQLGQVRQGEAVQFQVGPHKKLPGHRSQRVLLNPAGPAGAAVLTTAVKDWDVELDTAGSYDGFEVRVFVEKKDRDGGVRRIPVLNSRGTVGDDLAVYAPVVLDASPPEIDEFGSAAKKLLRGAPLPLAAKGDDPQSKIREVIFFDGKPVADPKQPDVYRRPPDAVFAVGKPVDEGRTTWEAELPVPTDKKGAVYVSVEFVNQAGLKKIDTIKVELVDPPAAAPGAAAKGGSIEGTVRVGDRPQPKVPVVLLDAAGAARDKATTDAKGVYAFKDVPAGSYRVTASKGAENVRGETTVQVKDGDKKTGVDIKLTR
jgi:hypothetical protein